MSNVTTITAYPEDTTGTAITNKVNGEQQIVMSVDFTEFNFVVPKFAPFFLNGLTASLKTVDGQVKSLVFGKDIVPGHRFIDASLAQSADIFGSLVFLDTTLSGILTIDSYQTVGGQWTLDDTAWAKIMADKVHNPRTLSWDSVVDLFATFPVKDHSHDANDVTGMGDVNDSIAKIEDAVAGQGNDDLGAHLNDQNNPHKTTAQQVGAFTREQSTAAINAATALAVANHVGAVDPHAQYLTTERANVLIGNAIGAVRQPKNVTPALAATNVSQTVTLLGSGYFSLYGPAQNGAQFQISRQQDFAANVVVDSGTLGAVTSYAVISGLQANAAYFWRCRYKDVEGTWSAWSAPTAFSTGSVIVNQPTVLTPSNGAVGVSNAPLLTSSPFAVTGGSDTHASSDWEIWTGANGSGVRVVNIAGSTGRTSYQLAAGLLSPNITYYLRVRYNATGAGTSAWSNDAVFTTAGVVTKPGITKPASGDVGILETPSLISTPFAVTGGSDTHASTDWQIWTAANGSGTKVFELLGSTTDKTTTVVPAGKLTPNTTYYARVRHTGAVLGVSDWSSDNSFTTAATFLPSVAGQPYGGGFYVGRMVDGADTYALIAAPKASGISSQPLSDGAPTAMTNRAYGYPNTMAVPSSPLALWAKGLTIGGYSDWYAPAMDELELMYRSFKPTTANNTAAKGASTYNPGAADGLNPNSSPAGAAYTVANPAQTTAAVFMSGGSEELVAIMGSSTVISAAGQNFQSVQHISTSSPGNQSIGTLNSAINVRAVRRVKITP